LVTDTELAMMDDNAAKQQPIEEVDSKTKLDCNPFC
jgi:hypothetical protein